MRKTYAGAEVDVSFDPEVCIHAAKFEHVVLGPRRVRTRSARRVSLH
jgi:hypothetical protein